jgi:formate dehydrogenase accessory protein FdhE
MAQVLIESGRWANRRKRAQELTERWPFADEVLIFYGKLLDVQERAYALALDDGPSAAAVSAYIAERVMPRVIEVSVADGPPALAAAVLEHFHEADLTELVAAWLQGGELSGVALYLARAASAPVLEALGPAVGEACAGPRDERHCPACGGLPQVSYFAAAPDDLVTGHRYLECSRCATAWTYTRLTCAGCGENDTSKLVVYNEVGTTQAELSGDVVKPGGARPSPPSDAQFPHMRIDGCETCSQYILTVDMERNGRAVPLVDELAALPLDLYAKERGLTKIAPNLVGF